VLTNVPTEHRLGFPPSGKADIAVDAEPGPNPYDTLRQTAASHGDKGSAIAYSTPFPDSLRADLFLTLGKYRFHNVLLAVVRGGKGFYLGLCAAALARRVFDLKSADEVARCLDAHVDPWHQLVRTREGEAL
jgi:hypothetical protein